MSLDKLEKYIEILLHLYLNKTATRNQIADKYQITYSTLSSLFNKWIDEGYIVKVDIEITYAGEDRYGYQITEKGIGYLKNMQEKLNKTLKK